MNVARRLELGKFIIFFSLVFIVFWGCSATTRQISEPPLRDAGHETSSVHLTAKPVSLAYFSSGSIEPRKFQEREAQAFIDELKNDKKMRLLLTGHTDQNGGDTLNEDLALQRAAAVAMELEKLGADTRQLVIRSFGEGQTQSDSENEKLEEQSRRVSALLIAADDPL